jgi:hypothetical protein
MTRREVLERNRAAKLGPRPKKPPRHVKQDPSMVVQMTSLEGKDQYSRVCSCCGELSEELLTIFDKATRKTVPKSRLRRIEGRSRLDPATSVGTQARPGGLEIRCINCVYGDSLEGGCPHRRTASLEDGEATV